MEGKQKIALFIDADNISARFGKLIMDNLESRGEVFIRRIYGNWAKSALRKWNDCILHYGLRTVHQIDFSSGKNATDMSLAIDAMDVLYKQQATTFAIVSNDSDFTPLAVRLREYGIYVIGVGRRDSSVSFKSACSEFISLDSLGKEGNVDTSFQVPNEQELSQQAETETETLQEDKMSESEMKILELERKIAELERRFSDPQWSIGFRLTAEENKNSVMQKSSGKLKQNIKIKSLPLKSDELLNRNEETATVEVIAVEILPPVTITPSTTIEPSATFKTLSETNSKILPFEPSPKVAMLNSLEIVKPQENIVVAEVQTSDEDLSSVEPVTVAEISLPLENISPLETSSTVDILPIKENETSAENSSIDTALSTENISAQIEPSTDSDKNISVESSSEISAQVNQNSSTPKEKVSTPKNESLKVEVDEMFSSAIDSQTSLSKSDRDKLMQQRLTNCGKNGMRNPKKKMQQIHDILHETAKLHGDKNGFVPLTFAGQDLKKKNLGFGVKDFGYALLNEFIGDFPELYELTHSKPRSFRYRCI